MTWLGVPLLRDLLQWSPPWGSRIDLGCLMASAPRNGICQLMTHLDHRVSVPQLLQEHHLVLKGLRHPGGCGGAIRGTQHELRKLVERLFLSAINIHVYHPLRPTSLVKGCAKHVPLLCWLVEDCIVIRIAVEQNRFEKILAIPINDHS